MKKTIKITFILLAFCSCSKIDGKIEERPGEKIYLVNTSKTKALNFTLKVTTVIDDTSYKYETQVIPLPPGDEEFIGKKEEFSKKEYLKKPPIINEDGLPILSRMENVDSTHPLPISHFIYKYEVTGQTPLK